MHEPFMYKLVPTVVDLMGNAFEEIGARADYVTTVIKSEEESFGRTLDRGIDIFNTAAKKAAPEKAETKSTAEKSKATRETTAAKRTKKTASPAKAKAVKKTDKKAEKKAK